MSVTRWTLCGSLVALLVSLCGWNTQAATFTWNDGTGNWSDGTQWNGTAPSVGGNSTDSLVFGSITPGNSYTSTINSGVSGNWTANSLIFGNSGTVNLAN